MHNAYATPEQYNTRNLPTFWVRLIRYQRQNLDQNENGLNENGLELDLDTAMTN